MLSLPQDAPSSYHECHFLLLYLNRSIYISPGGNLGLFQYFLVSHPVLPDQYHHLNQFPHHKYLLCHFYRINIPHLRFLQFVQFVVGGSLLPNQHQGK